MKKRQINTYETEAFVHKLFKNWWEPNTVCSRFTLICGPNPNFSSFRKTLIIFFFKFRRGHFTDEIFIIKIDNLFDNLLYKDKWLMLTLLNNSHI